MIGCRVANCFVCRVPRSQNGCAPCCKNADLDNLQHSRLMSFFHGEEYPEYVCKHFPVVLLPVGLVVDVGQSDVLSELAEHSRYSVEVSDPVVVVSPLWAVVYVRFAQRSHGCIPKVPRPSASEGKPSSGRILWVSVPIGPASVCPVAQRMSMAF